MHRHPARTCAFFVLASLLSLALATIASEAEAKARARNHDPKIDSTQFVTSVTHPFHPLIPGTVLRYLERDGKDTSEVILTVTHDTKVILGVSCVVVHDQVTEKGRVTEDTFDWFAQDRDGNVWYFGEETKEFDERGAVDTHGSWEAGVDGAKPGIVMPAVVTPGAPYRQEYSPGEAEDMGQIVAIRQKVTVPFGSFDDCVLTKDWSLLEAGTTRKWYARGIGFVREEGPDREVVSLVSVTRP